MPRLTEIPDKPVFLRQIIDKWNAGQAIVAATDLTRLLTTSKAQELDALSAECERRTGKSLAAFAADTHWSVCRARARAVRESETELASA